MGKAMIPDLLKYGAIGLACILSTLAYKLLLENKKTIENEAGQDFDDKLNLISYCNKSIYIFMGFASFLVTISLLSEIGQTIISSAESKRKIEQLDGIINQMEHDLNELRQSYQTTREEMTKYKTMVEMIKEQTTKRNVALTAPGAVTSIPKNPMKGVGPVPVKGTSPSIDDTTLRNIDKILKGQKPVENPF